MYNTSNTEDVYTCKIFMKEIVTLNSMTCFAAKSQEFNYLPCTVVYVPGYFL